MKPSTLPFAVLFSALFSSNPGYFQNIAFASAVSHQDVLVIKARLEEREPQFTIPIQATSINVLKNEVNSVLASDPYLSMDISNYQFDFIQKANGSRLAAFQIDYRENATQYAAVLKGVKEVLQKILKPGMDVYAKEKAIHDYVVLNTAYDSALQNYTAYDALYKQIATCQGYAMLTYQLLKAAGIPNLLISGVAVNSQGSGLHAWNEVDLNGKWYQLDTTWDDPIPNVPGKVEYNYFNLTTAQMKYDHKWATKGLPVADTNFVQVLSSSKNPQDQKIFKEIGLFAEEPGDTFSNLEKLQMALAKLRSGEQYLFRIPYQMINELSSIALPYQANFVFTRDMRAPTYALITLSVK